MESRTSPGKKGSVQPISGYQVVSARPFLAWVSTPVARVVVACGISSISCEAVLP